MIIVNDENLLRRPCDLVKAEDIGSLVNLLERELSNSNRLGSNGIGLAAPQIGVNQKIAIIRLGEVKLNLVNCEIKSFYDKMIFKDEGCLSFPSKNIDTYRYQEVCVVNNLSYPNSFIATGFAAIAVQHELDHINSVLYMDRAVSKTVPYVNKNKLGPNDPCFCGSGKKYKKCPCH